MGHTSKSSTMGMHNLNGFYNLIDRSNLNRVAFPDFASCCGETLTYKKLNRSPMHNLFLGKINTLTTC